MKVRFFSLMFLTAASLSATAPQNSILVSCDWLAHHLNDPSIVILHVGAQQDYEAGHIPGARLVTLSDISITDQSGLRLELPLTNQLEAAFGRLGVANNSRVIVYAGTASVQSATRVWFTLDYSGMGDRSALLDGGLAVWRAQGRPVSTEVAAFHATKFTVHPKPQLVVHSGWIRDHLNDRGVQIIDARLPDFFSGAHSAGMPRAGHIPGARNVPYTTLLAEDGALKSPQALREMFHADNGRKPGLIVTYCHIGQQATLPFFAARLLGLPARLYDGSFQDWSRRPDLPVAIAAAVPALSSAVDSIMTPLADQKSPGLAVLVRENGRTLLERGYGVRDLRSFDEIDAHTNFRLASCTKQFTAMAIMLLVHDGKLRYDTALADIFPAFPAYGRAITIRNLLTHTSGLPDYEDLMDAYEKAHGPTWSAIHQIQDREVLKLLEAQTSGKFAPGTSWSYSNSGYVLLGLIVAKTSGEPFGRFVHDRIFVPLRMDHSLVYVKGENTVPDRAYGYTMDEGHFIERDQSSTSATEGDGGVYSDIADLALWDAALENHTLLDAQEMTAALTPVKLSDRSEPKWPLTPDGDNLAPGKPVSYGFGWFLDPYEGHSRMWHFGSTMGFRTAIERFTSDKLTIVILANRTDLDPGQLALRIADMLFDGK